MSKQSWVETLATAQAAGTALNNSTSATSLLTGGAAQARFTLPANHFDYVGRQLYIRAAGRLSNIVTTPGTLTIDVRFGGTVVFNGGAMQLSTTAHTNLPWWLEIWLTCRTVGASAVVMGQARMSGQPLSLTAVADSTTTPANLLAPNTAPAVGNTFDAGASQIVDLFATFSIANASNGITIEQYMLQSLN